MSSSIPASAYCVHRFNPIECSKKLTRGGAPACSLVGRSSNSTSAFIRWLAEPGLTRPLEAERRIFRSAFSVSGLAARFHDLQEDDPPADLSSDDPSKGGESHVPNEAQARAPPR